MLKLILALLLILTGNIQLTAQSHQLIDSLLQTAHQRGIFNGNALVLQNGEVVYRNSIGYADGSRTKMLTPDMKFNIGSISKEFDGVGLMMLVEQGKLTLDDKVSDFFPELPAWAGQVCIKHLLQYTSGLPQVDSDRVHNDTDAWQVLHELEELEFEPGSGYIYSNYHTFLRRRIIENVFGKSYQEFLKTRIFEPLGMDGAETDLPLDAPLLATAFDNKYVNDDFPIPMSGSVLLTAQDLYVWTKQLHDHKVISPASLQVLFDGYENKRSILGTGIYEDQKLTMHWNSGSSYNFESAHYYAPQEDLIIILLTNNKNFNVGDLTTSIDAILKGQPFSVPQLSIYMNLRTEIYYEGFNKAMKWYKKVRTILRDIYDFGNEERDLLKTADYLIGKDRVDDGINVLQFTVKEFPHSAKALSALANAYLDQGLAN